MNAQNHCDDDFIYHNHLPLSNKLKRAIWTILCPLLFRPFVSPFLREWRNMILRIFGAKIGKGVSVHHSVKIWAPWNLILDDYTCIGNDVIIYNVDLIKVGKGATVSQNAYLCTASHDIMVVKHTLITAPITIGMKAWIGVRAYVGMGVNIGEGAVIGATASVYKDVESWTVVGGNPAHFLKRRSIKEWEE